MGQLVEFAKSLAEELKDSDIKATANVRNAVPPCALVVPVPRLEADILCGGWSATFTIVLLAAGGGDLSDAEALESLLDAVSLVVPNITTVEPAAYQLPTAPDPKPAYLLTLSPVSVTPEEES